MRYPLGTRLMLALHRITGRGVHQIYRVPLLRCVINFLDRAAGKPPT